MNNIQLVAINQNTKSALVRAKKLLTIKNKMLEKKNDEIPTNS
jgi:hypothetical protein